MNAAFIIVKDYSCFSFMLRPFPHVDLFDPHYRYEAFSTLHTKTFENDSYTLWRKLNTCACDLLIHRFHFDAFSTVFDRLHLCDMYTRFCFDPLSWTYLNRCVFGENDQRFSVGGPDWTNRNVCVIKRKRISVDARAYLSFPGVSYMPFI